MSENWNAYKADINCIATDLVNIIFVHNAHGNVLVVLLSQGKHIDGHISENNKEHCGETVMQPSQPFVVKWNKGINFLATTLGGGRKKSDTQSHHTGDIRHQVIVFPEHMILVPDIAY